MNNNFLQKHPYFILIVLYIIQTLFFFNYNHTMGQTLLALFSIAFTCCILWYWKKDIKGQGKNYLLVKLINSFSANVGSFLGILLVIHIILQVSFLEDFYIMWLDDKATVWHLLLIGNFLFLPFILLPYLPPITKKIEPSDRKLLIAGVSLLDYNRTNEEELSDHEITKLNEIKESDNQDWKNWAPIKNCLDHYQNIDRIYLLVSKQARDLLYIIDANTEYKKQGLLEMVNTLKGPIPIEYIAIEDIHNLNSNHDELKAVLNKKNTFSLYQDKEVLFDITSGTAALTAAVVINAIRSDRGLSYTRQDTRSVQEMNVDVFSLAELYDEILYKINIRTQEKKLD